MSKDKSKYLSAFIPSISDKPKNDSVKRSYGDGNKIKEIEKALAAIEESITKSNRDNLDAMYNIDEDNLSPYFKKKLAKFSDDITKSEVTIKALAESTRAGFEAVSSWQSEFEGKDYVTTTNLDAKIAEYIDGEKGQAAIVQSVSGKFVTISDNGYKNTQEISAAITQEINNFKSNITLSVTNGKKSSVISLGLDETTILSETISFTGEVVFKSDLSTEGATTINGANIETGTLKVEEVYYKDPNTQKFHSIISAQRIGDNTWTYIGPKDLSGNLGQYLQLYGTQIAFMSPNLTDEALVIDAENRVLYPSHNQYWSLGKDTRWFDMIYSAEIISNYYAFDSYDGAILYVDSSGNLIFDDINGNRHTIVAV